MKDFNALQHLASVACEIIHQVQHTVGIRDFLCLVTWLDFW